MTTEQRYANAIHKASQFFIDELGDDCPDDDMIPVAHAPLVIESFHQFIAQTIASMINAGSEADAVMENDELREAIKKEVDGWTQGA